MTTDEIKKLPDWANILKCINDAARMYKKQYPWSKVELVTKKHKFLIVVDGEPVTEITGENFNKSTPDVSNLDVTIPREI